MKAAHRPAHEVRFDRPDDPGEVVLGEATLRTLLVEPQAERKRRFEPEFPEAGESCAQPSCSSLPCMMAQ